MPRTKSNDIVDILKCMSADYAAPFVAAVVCGMAAHTFVFTNKLMNADEVDSLFGKGATVTSGRWGLEAVKLVFPAQSMPWLYGIITVLLFALSACLIIRLFDIRGKLIRVLLAGMITVFPSLTGTFSFMFTSSAYALSFLMAVTAVCVFAGHKGRWRLAVSVILLVLAVGIYQAYIATAASLFVLCLFKTALDGENSLKKLIGDALGYVAVMVAAVGVYLVVTLIVLKLTGSEFNYYVNQNLLDRSAPTGILGRIRMAYDFMVYYFSYREFALISGEASRYAHLLLAAVCAVGVVIAAVKAAENKKPFAAAAILAAAVILPLAINCLFLVFEKESIHSLMLYSFVSLYVLAAILMDSVFSGERFRERAARDVVYICLSLAVMSNIYFANGVYLKLYLQYENAYSFYSVLLNRVESTEGFDESCRLAIIGTQDNKLTRFDKDIDVGYLQGVQWGLVNIYSREKFFNYWLGTSIPFASEEKLSELKEDERFLEMNEYPYDGSVRKIDDCIVVRLG